MKNMPFHKLSFELVKAMVLIAVIPFVGMGIISYANMREMKAMNKFAYTQQAEEKISSLADLLAKKTNQTFSEIEKYSELVKELAEDIENNPDKYKVLYNPDEYMFDSEGAYTATRPVSLFDKIDLWINNKIPVTQKIKTHIGLTKNLETLYKKIKEKNQYLTWIYVTYENGLTRGFPCVDCSVNTNPKDFNPYENEYYLQAIPSNNPGKGPVWTQPYVDNWGAGWMVTCSIPLYNKNGDFFGVQSIDLTLETITKNILKLKVYKNGYAFLMDNKGNLIVCPESAELDLKYVDKKTFSLLDHPVLGGVVKKALQGEGISESLRFNNEPKHVVFSRIKATGWLVGVVVPVSEMQRPLMHLTSAMQVKVNQHKRRNAQELLIILIITILFLIFVVRHYSAKISNPIKGLSSYARELSMGNLKTDIDIRGKNIEVRELVDSFRTMKSSLKEIIKNIGEHSFYLLANVDDTESASRQISENILAMSELMRQIVSNAGQERRQIHEISAQITRCLGQTKQSSEQSHKNAGNAKGISDLISNQSSIAQGAINELSLISTKIEEVFNFMEKFKEDAKNIAKVTSILDEITEKTTYLALNASIEATRGGVQGKGFTVIAQEVKKLADQTSVHTKAISEIIASLTKRVSEQEQTKEKIAMQLKSSSQVILHALEPITSMTDEINVLATTSDETSNLSMDTYKAMTGIEQKSQTILELANENNGAIRDIDQNIEQNVSTIQHLAVMAQSLSQVAHQLNKTTQKFEV